MYIIGSNTQVTVTGSEISGNVADGVSAPFSFLIQGPLGCFRMKGKRFCACARLARREVACTSIGQMRRSL